MVRMAAHNVLQEARCDSGALRRKNAVLHPAHHWPVLVSRRSEVGVKVDLMAVARVQARHDARLLVLTHSLLEEIGLAPAAKGVLIKLVRTLVRTSVWSGSEVLVP